MKRFALIALSLMVATVAFGQRKGGGGGGGADSTPTPPPSRVPVGPGPKSKQEAEAVQAMLQARANPDATIQAVDTLVTKFPKSDFKSFALYTEANAWQQKNDLPKSQVFAEQALAADPKNYDAAILIANVLATTTKDTDFDMNDKLTQAEKYAHTALDLLAADSAKPVLFQMTEEVWTKIKNEDISQAWQAIGTAALVRKKTDDAVAAYQKGLDVNPDPFLMIRAGRALMAARKFDDAIAYDDKVLAMPDAPAQAKTIATSDKSRAAAAKGQK